MLDFKTNPLLTEIEQIIDGQTCTLVPDAEAAIEAHFAIDCRFDELNHISRELSPRQAALPDPKLQQNHHTRLPQSLRPELCEMVITQMQLTHEESIQFAIFERLLPVILNEQLTNLMCGYFDNEFALAGYSYSKNTAEQNSWYCVQGPQNMLCLEICLDDQGNGDSEVTFLDASTTAALKKCGVVFGHHDIPQLLASICRSKNVAYQETPE
jgi:hypothetical protein